MNTEKRKGEWVEVLIYNVQRWMTKYLTIKVIYRKNYIKQKGCVLLGTDAESCVKLRDPAKTDSLVSAILVGCTLTMVIVTAALQGGN